MTRAVPFAVALLVLWGCGSNTTETSGSDIDGSSVPDAQAVYEPDVPPDEGSAADLSNDEGPDEGIDAGEMGGDGGVDVDESDQGPDPAETDSDGDGLTDAEEIADGTDRNDPRSARAWPRTLPTKSR